MDKIIQRALSVKIAIKYLTALLVFVFVAVYVMNNESLSKLKKESIAKGELVAQSSGQEYADANKKLLKDMTTSLGVYRNEAMAMIRGEKPDRELFYEAIGNTIREKKGGGVLSFFTAWEPDGFDGKDKSYLSNPTYQAMQGRFAVQATYNGSNVVKSSLPRGFEKEEYYVAAKRTKVAFATKPYVTGEGDKQTLITTLSIGVVNDFGKYLGMIGVSLSLNDLQTNAEAVHPNGGNVSLISDEGDYIANGKDSSLLGKSFAEQEGHQAMWEKLRKGEMTQYANDEQGVKQLYSFVPLTISDGEIWYVMTEIPYSKITESYRGSQRKVMTMFFSTIIVLGIVIWLLTRYMITLPLKRMQVGIRQLALGDFTGKLRVSIQDEFGQMASHLNETTGSLGAMMKHTSELAMNVGATSEELTSSSEQVTASAESISKAVEEVAAGMTEQNDQAANTSRNMHEVTDGVRRIAESAIAVLESAKDVSAQTEKGDLLIRQAVEQMDEVNVSMTRSTSSMDRLREHSEEIGSIVELINRISSRTNILALNASIEAARAGEHGKGFAVVATEIRKLAEQTRDAVLKVEEKIESIRTETYRMTDVIAFTSSEVVKGSATVTDSGKIFSSITAEMKRVHLQAEEVSSSVGQLSAGIEQAMASVDSVKEITRMSTDNANQVAAASEEQLATMQEVTSSANHLSAMVQDLLDRLTRFKH
ncbi:methyl-accepting chemotaxis protein [Cohnella endophytica]|uniref:Methyl-accepting chemotaxis protein n=1 Tax=Cohnella endophytica TaxID=2419778 RepID=A0A494XIU6_9BACL|nr:methyl-accepting chemotaxis protein [Cohnella endophytica]RKP48004.1 methyl-accepting chemotaxis protein [Cohnella endophytica]